MDDIPPLEDMSDLVDRVKEKQKSSLCARSAPVTSESSNTVSKAKVPAAKNNNVGYGGMKKGFLFGCKTSKSNSNTTKAKNTSSTAEKFDYEIKGKQDDKKFVFDEVQEAVNKPSGFAASKEWLTDDLLKNIEGNKKLLEKMTNPKFSAAIELMQNNPKLAVEKYKDDFDVQEFFMEFYRILGSHFTKLGQQTSGTSTPLKEKSKEEIQFESIISRPDIREILAKPAIKELFTVLRSDPEQGQKLFHSSSNEVKADVQKLIDVGLLNFESRPNKT